LLLTLSVLQRKDQHFFISSIHWDTLKYQQSLLSNNRHFVFS